MDFVPAGTGLQTWGGGRVDSGFPKGASWEVV